MRSILATSHEHHQYFITYWKSAQECVGGYTDPHTNKASCIRPDAELLYTTASSPLPRSLLIEYDRATTYDREYRRKLRGYADYQHVTRTTLPPIVFITQNEKAVQTIQHAMASEKVFDVPIVFLLEQAVLHEGLTSLLAHPTMLKEHVL